MDSGEVRDHRGEREDLCVCERNLPRFPILINIIEMS